MARFNEQQTEQIRQERREQILAAALAVFAEHGVDGTKMSMIAKKAGMSHGLLYHYFASKEEVLRESLEWSMTGGDELINHIQSLPGSPLDKIAEFTRLALSEGSQDTFRIIQRIVQSKDLDASLIRIIETSGEKYIEFLTPIVIDGQKAGQIIDEDTDKLVGVYLTVISGIISDDLTMIRNDLEWHVRILLRMLAV